ncbi:hypothetical protein B4114_2160 [Geobacillus stearothermophilus]|uniref:Uncharacterized protein n=1 Tax=Geobacillus stearothermophilus TaxID=1422 RepID=A0A150NAB6_GEOSE|nr:hypothetical protein B4114_2160 [Geobacillus stearothermophilus]
MEGAHAACGCFVGRGGVAVQTKQLRMSAAHPLNTDPDR